MARGPICGYSNPQYVHTPGPIGINDECDPNNPVFVLREPIPLGLGPQNNNQKTPQSATKSAKKKIFGKVAAVASLKKPSPTKIRRLSTALNNVKKLNRQYKTSGKTKDELLRRKKEKVVKDIAAAYNVGLKYATGLEFSNRASDNLADTRGTFIVVFDGILEHPGFVASVVMHESSHAQRNAELQKAGVNRSDLGFGREETWKALIEIEAYQLEIDFAEKTGIKIAEKRGAERARDSYLRELQRQRHAGKKTRQKVENGGLEIVRAQFVNAYLLEKESGRLIRMILGPKAK